METVIPRYTVAIRNHERTKPCPKERNALQPHAFFRMRKNMANFTALIDSKEKIAGDSSSNNGTEGASSHAGVAPMSHALTSRLLFSRADVAVFCRDDQASVAPIFAIVLLPITALTGT